MNLGRIERQYARIPVTGTLDDGTPADLTDVALALLPPRARPDAATTWTGTTITGGRIRVLLAGPDATHTDALTVPDGGADLWIRVRDTPEIQTAHVERIEVT